uniref:Uncharacterized protein n=1 Tax=Arundo donax TaxID=35708 RepID=A0A0A8Z938_ARUDO
MAAVQKKSPKQIFVACKHILGGHRCL